MEKRNQLVAKLQKLKKCELLEINELEQLKVLRNRPRFWVNPFLSQRNKSCIEEHLLKDLLWGDDDKYTNFCRMTIADFESLLAMIESFITKSDTKMRYAIPARVRLAVTLRYLATGDSYMSLEYITRVSNKTISKFVPEVLKAIIDALEPTHLKMPQNEQEWLSVVADFRKIWDFPHTLGALDGKHIRIKAPPKSYSDFYNYKGFFSVVLLAIVNAHSKFIYVDIGCNGRVSDNIIFKNTSLYRSLVANTLPIPPPKQLVNRGMKIPYFFIGDDIFPLDKNLMKGYSRKSNLNARQEVFNYRLSRARMTVEMAFGRLANRFRIFHRPLETSLQCVDFIVKASCTLHNYISKDVKRSFGEHAGERPLDSLPENIISFSQQVQSNFKHASSIRDALSYYCLSEGDITHQYMGKDK